MWLKQNELKWKMKYLHPLINNELIFDLNKKYFRKSLNISIEFYKNPNNYC